MSEGQSSQRMSFMAPASVRVAPQTRHRTGPRGLRHGRADGPLDGAGRAAYHGSEGPGAGPQPLEEAAGAPVGAPARGAGERPGQREVEPGAGDADVQQAALLLDLLVGLGVGDGHHALGEADQEDGVPFEALGGVQRREGDALDGRGVLGGGPLVEFGDQVGEGGAGLGAGEVLGEPDECGEGLPAVADRAGAAWAAYRSSPWWRGRP